MSSFKPVAANMRRAFVCVSRRLLLRANMNRHEVAICKEPFRVDDSEYGRTRFAVLRQKGVVALRPLLGFSYKRLELEWCVDIETRSP
jgi:hypothetical protein